MIAIMTYVHYSRAFCFIPPTYVIITVNRINLVVAGDPRKDFDLQCAKKGAHMLNILKI